MNKVVILKTSDKKIIVKEKKKNVKIIGEKQND